MCITDINQNQVWCRQFSAQFSTEDRFPNCSTHYTHENKEKESCLVPVDGCLLLLKVLPQAEFRKRLILPSHFKNIFEAHPLNLPFSQSALKHQMGCQGFVQWSSLGNHRPWGLKKVRALPIHLNSNTVGLFNSQPLNIALSCAAIIVFFFIWCKDWVSCVSGVQVLPIRSGDQVLQLHTKPQI